MLLSTCQVPREITQKKVVQKRGCISSEVKEIENEEDENRDFDSDRAPGE